jgi:hypothetical protein
MEGKKKSQGSHHLVIPHVQSSLASIPSKVCVIFNDSILDLLSRREGERYVYFIIPEAKF